VLPSDAPGQPRHGMRLRAVTWISICMRGSDSAAEIIVTPPDFMGILILENFSCTQQDERDGLTRVLGWPGYRVYRHEIEEQAKTLKLWVRRKRGNRKLVCSGCGRKLADAYDTYEREVRDLPCFEFRTTMVVELYRVRCPDCGVKTEKVPELPSKAPFETATIQLEKRKTIHDCREPYHRSEQVYSLCHT
jgi:zinc-finger of transposase IS204/IS1001/IS1096/IS1165